MFNQQQPNNMFAAPPQPGFQGYFDYGADTNPPPTGRYPQYPTPHPNMPRSSQGGGYGNFNNANYNNGGGGSSYANYYRGGGGGGNNQRGSQTQLPNPFNQFFNFQRKRMGGMGVSPQTQYGGSFGGGGGQGGGFTGTPYGGGGGGSIKPGPGGGQHSGLMQWLQQNGGQGGQPINNALLQLLMSGSQYGGYKPAGYQLNA